MDLVLRPSHYTEAFLHISIADTNSHASLLWLVLMQHLLSFNTKLLTSYFGHSKLLITKEYIALMRSYGHLA